MTTPADAAAKSTTPFLNDMSTPAAPKQTTSSFADWTRQLVLQWTPRIIVVTLASYYSLGIAYEIGIMASIDKVAISMLKKSVGYAGIGTFMPTFQFYSAYAVRIIAAFIAERLYNLIEKICLFVFDRCRMRFFHKEAVAIAV